LDLSHSKILALFSLCLYFHSGQIYAQRTDYPYHKLNTGYGAYQRGFLEQIENEIPIETQDDSLEYLGRWGWGLCGGVATMGNYIFTGSGPTMLLLDVTDKRRPVVAWDTINSYVKGFAIQDSIGYALMGGSLVVVDFRNPIAPTIIGELYLNSLARTLVVEGPLVYVARFYGGLYVVDVSNPATPYLRNTVSEPAAWPNLAITNNNLYIVDSFYPETYYVNVSNPDSITVTQLNLSPFITGAYAKDSLLLLVNGRFYIYSIAVPASPVLLSSMIIPDVTTQSVTLKGDTAFIGAWDGKIVAVDISNRATPAVVGTYVPPVLQKGLTASIVAVEDTTLYSVSSFGITTFSVADPSSISALSLFPTGHEFNKVIVRNGLAYVTSGRTGLWVVDVSNPSDPRRVGNFQTEGYAYDIIIDSTIAYLSLNDPGEFINEEPWNGIWTLDISRPDSMRVLGTYMTNDAFNISKSGSLLFVTHGNDILPAQGTIETTVTILDVSDPSDMQREGWIVAEYDVPEIASKDSIAFIAGWATPDIGLKIYDCRDPANPQLLSTTISRARAVSISGNNAYIHRADSFFIADITDLSVPTIVGRVRNLSPISNTVGLESIAAQERVFWTAVNRFGAIDVSNPNGPRNLFQDSRATYGRGIDIVGDTIYVTDYYEGLRIFRYKLGPTSVESNEPTVGSVYLFPNYPNPFNPITSIRFEVPGAGLVSLRVYNLLGQEVATLVNEELKAGSYETVFNASNLPSGIYFYRLSASGKNITRKMVVLR
jgi:hypothetical protein